MINDDHRAVPKFLEKLEFIIVRNKKGFVKKIYPVYNLLLNRNGGFVLAAQKMNMIRSSNYLISLDKTKLNPHSSGALAKLRSDNSGIEYNLFTNGENPKNTQIPDKVRNQLAAIYYVII